MKGRKQMVNNLTPCKAAIHSITWFVLDTFCRKLQTYSIVQGTSTSWSLLFGAVYKFSYLLTVGMCKRTHAATDQCDVTGCGSGAHVKTWLTHGTRGVQSTRECTDGSVRTIHRVISFNCCHQLCFALMLQCFSASPQQSVKGSGKDDGRLYVVAVSSLWCFDTVGWVTGRTSGR